MPQVKLTYKITKCTAIATSVYGSRRMWMLPQQQQEETAAGRVAIEMFSHQYNERSMVHSNLVHIMHHIEYTVTI